MPSANIARALTIALAMSSVAVAGGPGAAPRVDLRGMTAIHGNPAAAKTRAAVCSACHGHNGVSVVPTFPNLAGQSATYLYLQMRAYRDGARSNEVMRGQMAALGDADMRNLAAWFAALPAAAGDGGDRSSRGGTLYHDGDRSLGIPACQGCHGRAGHGPQPDPASRMPGAAWATFPALAGQKAAYIATELHAYRDGTRAGSSNTEIMHGVAQNLGDDDIAALADYIASM